MWELNRQNHCWMRRQGERAWFSLWGVDQEKREQRVVFQTNRAEEIRKQLKYGNFISECAPVYECVITHTYAYTHKYNLMSEYCLISTCIHDQLYIHRHTYVCVWRYDPLYDRGHLYIYKNMENYFDTLLKICRLLRQPTLKLWRQYLFTLFICHFIGKVYIQNPAHGIELPVVYSER